MDERTGESDSVIGAVVKPANQSGAIAPKKKNKRAELGSKGAMTKENCGSTQRARRAQGHGKRSQALERTASCESKEEGKFTALFQSVPDCQAGRYSQLITLEIAYAKHYVLLGSVSSPLIYPLQEDDTVSARRRKGFGRMAVQEKNTIRTQSIGGRNMIAA